MKKTSKVQPAIFYDVDRTYRADSCEPLRKAKERGELAHAAFARRSYPGYRLPPKIMPELCVACVWDAKQDQTWGLPMHRNEGIELGYLTRGKLDFIVEEKLYKLKSGALTVTRPWQPHKVGDPLVHASRMHWLILDVGVRRPNEAWKWPNWFTFSPGDLARLTELLRYNEQPVWQANERIERCFENIAEYVSTGQPEQVQTRLQLNINELFLEVYEMLQEQDIQLDSHLATTKRNVEMFLEALPKHIDYPWTLESMAKHCDLGRSRFTHYCRQITNMSPTEYLIHCRIEAAKKILKFHPDRKITEIAFSCGFESSQYFANVFKRYVGCSPKLFRAG
ncbi:MAG: HTH-type transcriptional activator RhaS [Planctomycetes bacterium ADurb.Bin412]|nr:MAG: HTH-type transcriptional activator RhaS [Planctomycetes bacterium ADurb.Bin412]